MHVLKGLGVVRKFNSYPRVQWGMTTWVQASSVQALNTMNNVVINKFHKGKVKQSLIFKLRWLYRVLAILKSSSLTVWPTIICSSGHKLAWPNVVFADQVGAIEVVISYLVDFQRDRPSSTLPRSREAK